MSEWCGGCENNDRMFELFVAYKHAVVMSFHVVDSRINVILCCRTKKTYKTVSRNSLRLLIYSRPA